MYWKKLFALLRIRFILWRRRPARWFFSLLIAILLLLLAAVIEYALVNDEQKEKVSEAAYELSLSASFVDIHQYQSTIFTSQNNPVIIRAQTADYNAATQYLSSSNYQYVQLPTEKTYNDLGSYGKTESHLSTFYAGADIQSWPRPGSGASVQAQYTVWYNGSFMHSLPTALNVLNSMFYRTMTSNVRPSPNGKLFR